MRAGFSPTSYTSKIIKASALLPDTKLLLAHWDEKSSVRINLDYARRANVFGKSSRSRLEDILAIFRQRYLADADLFSALTLLVQAGSPSTIVDPIFYFCTLQADRLLHDAVSDLLVRKVGRGQQYVYVNEVRSWVQEQVDSGRTTTRWGSETIERVAQGIMATLRDFGILEGAVNKRLVSLYLPTQSFAFIARLLSRDEPSGDRLLNHPEWQVFFMTTQAVERAFLEAHQARLLQYYAAGSVVRIEFPASTLRDYAHVLLESANRTT